MGIVAYLIIVIIKYKFVVRSIFYIRYLVDVVGFRDSI